MPSTSPGASRSAVARLLGVSEGTVRYQVARMAAGAVDGRSAKQLKATTVAGAIEHWREMRGEGPINLALHDWLVAEHGFGCVHELRPERYPSYRFCSMHCVGAGSALARRRHGMIDKTDMEQQAIWDARRFFAEALTELGMMAPFQDRSPAEVDRLIEACVAGYRDSMQRQSLNNYVPPF